MCNSCYGKKCIFARKKLFIQVALIFVLSIWIIFSHSWGVMLDVCWQFVWCCWRRRSAYLESWYWSHATVLHLNIRHSVKAGAHLKQKGLVLEQSWFKSQIKQQSFQKETEISKTQEKWLVLELIFDPNDTSLLPEECQEWQGCQRPHFIFFRTISRTNEEGYDQFDQISAIVP